MWQSSHSKLRPGAPGRPSAAPSSPSWPPPRRPRGRPCPPASPPSDRQLAGIGAAVAGRRTPATGGRCRPGRRPRAGRRRRRRAGAAADRPAPPPPAAALERTARAPAPARRIAPRHEARAGPTAGWLGGGRRRRAGAAHDLTGSDTSRAWSYRPDDTRRPRASAPEPTGSAGGGWIAAPARARWRTPGSASSGSDTDPARESSWPPDRTGGHAAAATKSLPRAP